MLSHAFTFRSRFSGELAKRSGSATVRSFSSIDSNAFLSFFSLADDDDESEGVLRAEEEEEAE